jgi:hypothetical protein
VSLDDFSVASGALGRHRGIQVVLVISKRETNGALWCTPILRSHKMCFTDILRSFLLGKPWIFLQWSNQKHVRPGLG